MTEIKKLAFVFGDITLTLTENDIGLVMDKLYKAHPGREITGPEFAEACLEHMKSNAKPTRTVLHN